MLKSGECLLIIPLFNLLLLKIITCCSTIEVSGNLWKQSSIVFYKRITNDIFQNYSKIRKNIIAVFKNILQDYIHLILHSILQ
jgi:hypothetical protein